MSCLGSLIPSMQFVQCLSACGQQGFSLASHRIKDVEKEAWEGCWFGVGVGGSQVRHSFLGSGLPNEKVDDGQRRK